MGSMKRIGRAAARMLCAGLLCAALAGGRAVAAGDYHYTYDQEGRPVAAPAAVEPYRTLTGDTAGTSAFSGLRDLFLAADGQLYLADGGNNRIVVLDREGRLVREITGFEREGKTETFAEPAGIFVTAAGELFIADSKNARVVRLDREGRLAGLIEAPRSEVLPDNFYFKPSKIAVDGAGRIFVVSEGFNMGLLEFDPNGAFVQSMGAPRVAVNPIDLLWRSIATKEQRQRMVSYVPTEYNSVLADEEGFLFVTTSAYEYWQYLDGKIQPIRRLNAKGEDVLVRYGEPVGDLDFPTDGTYKGPSAIVDIAATGYGGFAALDQKRGRVFAYNAESELLYEFGGPGDYDGGLSSPCALAYRDGVYYIADSKKNSVYLFRLTAYGQLFADLASAQHTVDFEAEEALWNRIVKENVNCALATRGLGNAAYRTQDMEQAMAFYRLAEDREGYSKAYAFVRRAWIENNAPLLLGIVLAAVAAVIAAFRLKKRVLAGRPRDSYLATLAYADHVLFHPLDGFWDLKRERRGSLPAALTILGGVCVTMILSALFTGFIFNPNDLHTYNLLSEVVKVAVLFLVWCVSLWCVTSLMEGEGRFRDIAVATCYALTPYIPLNLAGIVLSNVMLENEGDFYRVLVSLSFVWMAALLLCSVRQTHNYSMPKTLAVVLITFIVILLIAFVAMLLLALTQQMAAFVRDLYDEITLRL